MGTVYIYRARATGTQRAPAINIYCPHLTKKGGDGWGTVASQRSFAALVGSDGSAAHSDAGELVVDDHPGELGAGLGEDAGAAGPVQRDHLQLERRVAAAELLGGAVDALVEDGSAGLAGEVEVAITDRDRIGLGGGGGGDRGGGSRGQSEEGRTEHASISCFGRKGLVGVAARPVGRGTFAVGPLRSLSRLCASSARCFRRFCTPPRRMPGRFDEAPARLDQGRATAGPGGSLTGRTRDSRSETCASTVAPKAARTTTATRA